MMVYLTMTTFLFRYQGNPEIIHRHAQLKERMLRLQARPEKQQVSAETQPGGNSKGIAPKKPVRKSFNSSLAVRSTSPLCLS